MKTHSLTTFFTVVRVALITHLALTAGVWAQSGSIAVNDPRPLASAADELERLSGVAVHYEDAHCTNPSDVVDVTEQVARPEGRAKYPNARVLIPRGGDLAMVAAMNTATGRIQDLDTTLAQLLKLHVAKGFPGVYMAKNVNGAQLIVPVQVLQKNGGVQWVNSVLDYPITFPVQPRTALQTLELILSSVSSASGYKLWLGTAPLRGLDLAVVSMGADNESAQSVVLRLIEQYPVPLSYRLLFSPSQNNYMFNAHMVRNSVASPPPNPAIAAGSGNPALPGSSLKYGKK